MTKITLPYSLQDGQKAYASRLMANFNAIVACFNNIEVEGLDPGSIDEIAAQLLQATNDFEAAVNASIAAFTAQQTQQQAAFEESTDNKLAAFEERTTQRVEAFETGTDQKLTDFETETNSTLEAYETETNERISAFETATEQEIADFKTATNETVSAFEERTEQRLTEFETATNQTLTEQGEALQADFDALEEELTDASNAFIAQVNQTLATFNAGNVAFTATAAIAADTVQAAIEEVQRQIAESATGSIPDGSLGEEKLNFTPAVLDENGKLPASVIADESIGAGKLAFTPATLGGDGKVPAEQLPEIEMPDTTVTENTATTITGLLKGNGTTVQSAVPGVDYQTPLRAGTDYQTPLAAGTDYQTPLRAGTDYQRPLTPGTDYQTPLTPGTDYQTPLTAGTDYVQPTALSGYIPTSEKGAASGVATLNSIGKVPGLQTQASISYLTESYSVDSRQQGVIFVCENDTAITLTLPAVSGMECEVVRRGAGEVTFAAESGMTILSPGGALSIGEQYGTVSAKCLSSITWLLSGCLA